AVKAAATTFRQNPAINVEETITQLGVGEALLSMLDEKGTPTPVDRALVIPPGGQIGPITAEQRQAIIKASTLFGHYEHVIERHGAHAELTGRTAAWAHQQEAGDPSAAAKLENFRKKQAEAPTPGKASATNPGFFQKLSLAFGTSLVRSIATAV